MKTKTKIFMRGNWEDLIIQTYTCEPEILKKYLPRDVELDLYKGKALFSMVAFTFSKVSFFGVKVPFHQKFGEINFRFYTKSKIDNSKGVVFIKELAPKPIVAFVANAFYNEPFFFKNIKYHVSKLFNKKLIRYRFNRHETIAAITDGNNSSSVKTSLQRFIVDRYIAYVKGRNKKTFQYKINHKPWKLLSIDHVFVSDKVLNLLPSFFKNFKPLATYLVDGSEITVEKGILQNKANYSLA